ncbi:hypothetical protein, partial [Klebsiella aerogenes]|uniref:hypothetical protein n=1 Tax=Klebsiella aerogenes TaxID=548 RepID=UPI001CC47091
DSCVLSSELTQSERKNTGYFTGKYLNEKTEGKELKYVRNPEKNVRVDSFESDGNQKSCSWMR